MAAKIPWWKRLQQQFANYNPNAYQTPAQQYAMSGQQSPPAWKPPKPPTSAGTNATPTGSFIGGGGSVVIGANQQPVPSTIPTGSFIGGGGQYVLGPNQQAYQTNPTGPNTFIGAGGEAVRGPDETAIPTPSTGGGGGGGGYGGYSRRRRRGGGGRPYQPPQYEQRQQYENGPAWARGLSNWTIG